MEQKWLKLHEAKKDERHIFIILFLQRIFMLAYDLIHSHCQGFDCDSQTKNSAA